MRDTPRVVRNSETDEEWMCQTDTEKGGRKDIRGVEDPANGVVDEFGLGVGLVATFMGNDPNASGNETRPEGIERPDGEFSGPVKDGVRELDDFRMDTGINEGGGLVDSSQGSKIRETDGIYALDFRRQRKKRKSDGHVK